MRELRILVTAVLGLPLHKAVFARRDCSSFARKVVAHHAYRVVHEHRGYLDHIIAQLTVRFRHVGVFTRRRFQFDEYERQSVDKENNVGPLVAVFYVRPLVGYNKGIVVAVSVVYKVHNVRGLFPVIKITDLDAVLQVLHKHRILLRQVGILEIMEFV